MNLLENHHWRRGFVHVTLHDEQIRIRILWLYYIVDTEIKSNLISVLCA